jgi:hypothetical protein
MEGAVSSKQVATNKRSNMGLNLTDRQRLLVVKLKNTTLCVLSLFPKKRTFELLKTIIKNK